MSRGVKSLLSKRESGEPERYPGGAVSASIMPYFCKARRMKVAAE